MLGILVDTHNIRIITRNIILYSTLITFNYKMINKNLFFHPITFCNVSHSAGTAMYPGCWGFPGASWGSVRSRDRTPRGALRRIFLDLGTWKQNVKCLVEFHSYYLENEHFGTRIQGRSQDFEKGGAFLTKRAEFTNYAAGGLGRYKPPKAIAFFGTLWDDLGDFREHPPTIFDIYSNKYFL